MRINMSVAIFQKEKLAPAFSSNFPFPMKLGNPFFYGSATDGAVPSVKFEFLNYRKNFNLFRSGMKNT